PTLHLLLYLFYLAIPPPPTSTLFPYTTLFRSHQVRALLQLLFDEMVEEVSSRDPGPGVLVSVGKRVRDVDPVLAAQTLSKPIAEERVRPRCFLRAKIRRPSRGIGNVSHGSWCCRWLRPGHQILHVQPIRISFCKNI